MLAAVLSLLSMVNAVTNATTPPGRTWSMAFGEKIIVDGKSQLVVRLIVDLVLTEGHVAHSEVIKITAVGGFKSGNGNVSLRIQFFRNAPSDAVQLHAVQRLSAMLSGSIPKKLPTPMDGSKMLPD